MNKTMNKNELDLYIENQRKIDDIEYKIMEVRVSSSDIKDVKESMKNFRKNMAGFLSAVFFSIINFLSLFLLLEYVSFTPLLFIIHLFLVLVLIKVKDKDIIHAPFLFFFFVTELFNLPIAVFGSFYTEVHHISFILAALFSVLSVFYLLCNLIELYFMNRYDHFSKNKKNNDAVLKTNSHKIKNFEELINNTKQENDLLLPFFIRDEQSILNIIEMKNSSETFVKNTAKGLINKIEENNNAIEEKKRLTRCSVKVRGAVTV